MKTVIRWKKTGSNQADSPVKVCVQKDTQRVSVKAKKSD